MYQETLFNLESYGFSSLARNVWFLNLAFLGNNLTFSSIQLYTSIKQSVCIVIKLGSWLCINKLCSIWRERYFLERGIAEIGSKTMLKWPKQITGALVEQLIRVEKDIQKAILIFDAATGECTNWFRHDHSTFGLMISRFISANQFRTAEDLLNGMKDEKCDIKEDIFLSICRGYGEAIRIFEKMKEYECERTQNSYITVFDILVGENQLKLALRFHRYMREKRYSTKCRFP